MIELSDALERVNVSRALLICSGQLYGPGSVERNTLDFVHYEQALVQEALDCLLRRDPRLHSEQVRKANGAIHQALRRRSVCTPFSDLGIFARAAQACRFRLGRMFDFSTQSDREALGEELARSARQALPASRIR